MRALVYGGIGLGALWLQLTVAPLIAIAWVKPSFLLLTVLVAGLRWLDPWLFVYAAAAGLAQDVFSHGVLGIYGISFFAISFVARLAGTSIYEHNVVFNVLGVFGLSLAEGIIAVSVFNLLDPSVPWWGWLFGRVIPAALYNSLLSPLLFLGLERLERKLKWSPT